MHYNNFHVESGLLKQLDQKQKQIGEYLLNCNLDYTDRIGIMDGLSGMVLAFSLYYRNTGDERFFDKMNEAMDLIYDKIYSGNAPIVTYCSGIAGYAWLILYLKENELIEVDLGDYLSDIDKFLLQYAIIMIENKQFDPLHGVVGIGFYFLKRGNFSIIEKIIEALYHDRKEINGYLTWSWIKDGNEIADFGLAHGIPGALFFLYKCYIKKFSPQKCSEMIRNNVSFMLKHINISGTPSYFPSSIECVQKKQFDGKQNFSRLAWCYGDLTALYVLLKMSQSFPLEVDFNNMLEQVSERKNYSETLVRDAGFCHGTSGIAQIFNRLYHETGNTCFKETAIYWMERTLLWGTQTEGIAGYVFTENQNIPPLDVLVGISGVALTLLSFLNPKLINWDESMFLS